MKMKIVITAPRPDLSRWVPELTTKNLSSIDEFVSLFVRDNVIKINDYSVSITDVQRLDNKTLVFDVEYSAWASCDIDCALSSIASLMNVEPHLI